MTAPLFDTDARQSADGMWTFSREEFARERFDYKPGEHTCFGGPTQVGKTTLAFQLLQYCATPECPAYVAVSKPNDPVTTEWGNKLHYRRVSEWPPPKRIQDLVSNKTAGFLVWPKFGDIDNDTERAASVTAALMAERYAAGARNKGRGILVMDDTMVKAKILGLDRQMTTILAMAGAMDLGLWVFVQKPTDSGRTPIWSYSMSEHLFLANDPDRKNQLRYDEIGGVDPKLVASTLRTLKPHQFLYIKRSGRHMCIVDAK